MTPIKRFLIYDLDEHVIVDEFMFLNTARNLLDHHKWVRMTSLEIRTQEFEE